MSVSTDPDPIEGEQEEVRGQMSFFDHLEELRTRILHALVAVGISFAACWTFGDSIFRFVSRPINAAVGDGGMIFLSPTEPFNLLLKVSLIASLFLASPFIMAQVWLFISPGLYKHERRYAAPFIISSSLLFIIGGAFGYFVAFPFALQFLIAMGRDLNLKATISAVEYFDLFMMVELGLGVVFEIPAIIFVLARIGLVSAGFLLKNTKYAVLLAFVVAAVITPTSDIPNMMIMAVPMILLYLLGVVVAFVFGKKRKAE
jgi:sec-independent protein translocase protein TatC